MKKILLGDPVKAASYLGVAKKLLAQARRIGASYPLRLPLADGTHISAQIHPWGDEIIIFGSFSPYPLILLSGADSGYGYNYLTRKYAAAKIVDLQDREGAELVQLFNGRCQFQDAAFSTYRGGWVAGTIGNDRQYLGGLNAYELAFFYGDAKIYGRVEDDTKYLAQMPDIVIPSLCGAYGPLFGVVGYKTGTPWNKWRGSILYSYNPVTGNQIDSWYWVPSFFSVFPGGNENFLVPGWYYGGNLTPEYGYVNETYQPLYYAKVSLKAVLDCRSYSTGYNFGWCEQVKKWTAGGETETPNDLFFYLDTSFLQAFPAGYEWYENRQFGQHSLINIGSSLNGFTKTFQINGPEHGMSDPEVTLWSFPSWVNDLALTPPDINAVGVIVAENKTAKVYRYKDFRTPVYETTSYHSHSISRDGKIVAIFEGSTAIERVKVFDLYGSLVDGEYTSGGFTEVSKDKDLSSLLMTQGVIIPFRETSFSPAAFDLSSVSPPTFPTDITETFPALGQLNFFKDGGGPVHIYKLVNTNGVDAELFYSTDECFSSTIVIDDPDKGIELERLVAAWDFAGGLKGVVRGQFEGNQHDMTFNGEGNGEILTVSMVEELGLILNEGEFGAPDRMELQKPWLALGTINYGKGYANSDDDEIDYDDAFECGPTRYDFSLTTSCGQTGAATIDLELPPVGVTGYSYAEEGAEFTATGGKPPYSWTFDSGSLSISGSNKQTAEITSIPGCDTPGTPRLGKITVTDYCGESAEVEFMLPGGAWACIRRERPLGDVDCSVGDASDPWSGCGGGAECETFPSVGTKVRERWKSSCCDCFQQYCREERIPDDFLAYSDPQPCTGEEVPRTNWCLFEIVTYRWECP